MWYDGRRDREKRCIFPSFLFSPFPLLLHHPANAFRPSIRRCDRFVAVHEVGLCTQFCSRRRGRTGGRKGGTGSGRKDGFSSLFRLLLIVHDSSATVSLPPLALSSCPRQSLTVFFSLLPLSSLPLFPSSFLFLFVTPCFVLPDVSIDLSSPSNSSRTPSLSSPSPSCGRSPSFPPSTSGARSARTQATRRLAAR
jgi:hypothetical protein